jgi:4-hydroxybenzoate polyprenyltransferase
MGSIDPIRTRPTPAPPIPVQAPTQRSVTAAGALGLGFGFLMFVLGSFAGVNLFLMGLGGLFMAAGYYSRQKPPAKLCPACRMEIPAEATVCGHCRTGQAA